jgi:hypothetical protein
MCSVVLSLEVFFKKSGLLLWLDAFTTKTLVQMKLWSTLDFSNVLTLLLRLEIIGLKTGVRARLLKVHIFHTL